MTTKEKRGIWLLPVRSPRPTTAHNSERDRVTPTPLVYIVRPKSVLEDMVSPLHADGTVYTYP